MDQLDAILNRGLQFYTAVKGNNNTGPAKTVVAAPAASQSPAWLPIALIGGGIALVIALVFAFRK